MLGHRISVGISRSSLSHTNTRDTACGSCRQRPLFFARDTACGSCPQRPLFFPRGTACGSSCPQRPSSLSSCSDSKASALRVALVFAPPYFVLVYVSLLS